MTRLFVLCFSLSLFASDIPLQKAKIQDFSKSITLNAKIVQLSNAKQALMSQVSGHIEKYFVTPNQKIKAGQAIALIQSTKLSQLTAEFIATKRQVYTLSKNYGANKNLYQKGLISLQELNTQSIQKETVNAKLSTLKSQLQTLGIDTKTLKKASADYIVYAHSGGLVSSILQPLHSVVDEEEELISIVKEQAFFIESYLPLKYIQKVKVGDKLVVELADENIVTHISQILPAVDEKTQRVVLLSPVTQKTKALFIGAFVEASLFVHEHTSYVAVEKSALSFFNNEWVIFVPKEDHDEHEEHEEHDSHAHHEEHAEDAHHDTHEEEEHEAHEEHGHEEHEEVPYAAKVVDIITKDENFVAIKGLEEGEMYVSDKSYYVKSMLLKSSLGGHGH